MVRVARIVNRARSALSLATFAALLLLAGVVGCQSRAAASSEPAASTGATPNAADTTVLLYANLSEADEECVCGQIIRAVRAAAAKGVKTREVDTRDKDKKAAVSKQYKITVSPAVLFLDPTGKETSRFEGESSETVTALMAGLEKLVKR